MTLSARAVVVVFRKPLINKFVNNFLNKGSGLVDAVAILRKEPY